VSAFLVHNVSSFLVENPPINPSEEFVRSANIKTPHLYEYGNKNRIAFWEGCAQSLQWFKKWNAVLEWDAPFAKWYEGGKLNASVNCLDRHMLSAIRDKVAIYWEGEDGSSKALTYQDLYHQVNRLASGLKNLGVKKGDCVAIYLPMIPEAVASMLACARIGAIHTVVFGGFSAESLQARIQDANAKVLITADIGYRRGKKLQLQEIAQEAVNGLTCIEKVIVVQRQKESCLLHPEKEIGYNDLLHSSAEYCQPEVMDADDVLFILYTSGTTGKPKGVVHSTAGYMVAAHVTTKLVFDVKSTDVYFCTADIGWITGHTYVTYGPLSNGMTQVMYEGAPDYPSTSRFWEIIQKYKVSIFYTAPTVIRLFMKWGEQCLSGFDLTSLRLLGSVGEPLNPEAWQWFYKNVGHQRCPIVDTWWQTETGSIMMTTLPAIMPMKPGFVGKPLPGIDIKILDDYGNEAAHGYLAITSPWPSMARGIHGDTRRFVQTYWNKWGGRYYFSGDGAGKDKEGYFWISGRVDDVLNVAAHRIGTMEVESALIQHTAIAESAVIGLPDEVTGQSIAAFVVLKKNQVVSPDLKEDLKDLVAKKIGVIAKPKQIYFVEELPKTRSGKIMRRLLKEMALGKSFGDLTALEDPRLLKTLESCMEK
jgi:acetyl-CoA synthetase